MLIHSIFNSLDGEVNEYGQARFTTFVRLAGCNLRCSWGDDNVCDTPFALEASQGSAVTVDNVVKQIEEIECKKITITGGEPLLQQESIIELVQQLGDDYAVTIETNGSIVPLRELMQLNVFFVVDYKLPSSSMESKMERRLFYNVLCNQDFIKFVIADKEDYDRAKAVMSEILKLYPLYNKPQIAFSPCSGMKAKIIFNWMQRDKLFNVWFNIQIHKLLDLP